MHKLGASILEELTKIFRFKADIMEEILTELLEADTKTVIKFQNFKSYLGKQKFSYISNFQHNGNKIKLNFFAEKWIKTKSETKIVNFLDKHVSEKALKKIDEIVNITKDFSKEKEENFGKSPKELYMDFTSKLEIQVRRLWKVKIFTLLIQNSPDELTSRKYTHCSQIMT